MHTMPTPKHTTNIPTPEHLDSLTYRIEFRLATYDPHPGYDGGTFLECWRDGEWWEHWEGPETLAEARAYMTELTLEDIG